MMSGNDLETSFLGGIRSNVPYPEGVVHRVCQNEGPVRGQSHSSHRVGVAGHRVQDWGGLARVPNFNQIVDTSANLYNLMNTIMMLLLLDHQMKLLLTGDWLKSTSSVPKKKRVGFFGFVNAKNDLILS